MILCSTKITVSTPLSDNLLASTEAHRFFKGVLSKLWHAVDGVYMWVLVYRWRNPHMAAHVTRTLDGNSSPPSTTSGVLSGDIAHTGGQYGYVRAFSWP